VDSSQSRDRPGAFAGNVSLKCVRIEHAHGITLLCDDVLHGRRLINSAYWFRKNARQNPGSQLERQAREVQRAEWQLLFDYCARPL
jgi:hypothetical protein